MRLKGSEFDPSYLRRLQQLVFLRHLSSTLTRPVSPDGEVSEYLVTQVVAEFLSKRFDGLIYSSAQVEKGFNTVLFGDAASVIAGPLLADEVKVEVETTVMTSDGFEPDYNVTEILPEGETQHSQLELIEAEPAASLQLERDTLKVHHVEAVVYKTEQFFARRYRFSSESSDF